MMDIRSESDLPADDRHWFTNLVVCTAGSFTTIVAMTLLLPFLPLYVEEIGVSGHAAIVQWSGVAYGATFFTAALTAPLWGRLGDLYGRKLMLIRASLGMAVAMSLTGMAENIWQLVAVRLLTGLLGGYASGSMILVAAQTPKAKSGWALGVLSSGIMAGNLVGPLIGGSLPPLIGIRATFSLSGAAIFVSFLGTTFLLRENPRPPQARKARVGGLWRQIADKRPVVAMLATGLLLTFALTSIEPIITVYVALFVPPDAVTFVAGLAMSAGALGGILSRRALGRLADRIGHWRIVVGCRWRRRRCCSCRRRSWQQLAAHRAALPDGRGARGACCRAWRASSATMRRRPSPAGCSAGRCRRNTSGRCSGRWPAASSAATSACAPSFSPPPP